MLNDKIIISINSNFYIGCIGKKYFIPQITIIYSIWIYEMYNKLTREPPQLSNRFCTEYMLRWYALVSY